MTEEIRKAAEDLLFTAKNGNYIDKDSRGGTYNITESLAFLSLEKSLRPSREHVADYLAAMCRDAFNGKNKDINQADRVMLGHAIEELRK